MVAPKSTPGSGTDRVESGPVVNRSLGTVVLQQDAFLGQFNSFELVVPFDLALVLRGASGHFDGCQVSLLFSLVNPRNKLLFLDNLGFIQ